MGSTYKSFAVKVIGGSHLKNNIPCQDASYCEDFKDAAVSIAVVADGHGDKNCFRSDKGADFAVRCAKNGIYNFVKDHENLFKSGIMKKAAPPSQKSFEKTLREKLIVYTVHAWNKWVWEDYEKNPFTQAEIEGASERYRAGYKKGEHISKAYGTSLIAAAITPYYWFGFHIGDGRLSALYPDGSFEQPVPWDERCYLNVTTSICDEDVLTRDSGVRSFLSIHAESEKAPPAALLLCTDGVDDNYPVVENEKHLFKLYRTIAITFDKDGFDSTRKQLEDLAYAFATKGKGDDTSIAGFIDLKAIKKAIPFWQKQINDEQAEAKNAAAPKEEKSKEGPEEKSTAEVSEKYGSFEKRGIVKKISISVCVLLALCAIGLGLRGFLQREAPEEEPTIAYGLEEEEEPAADPGRGWQVYVSYLNRADEFISAQRHELARTYFNRILVSDNAEELRELAQRGLERLEAPDFDTFKWYDNVSYNQAMQNLPLHRGVHVVWQGTAGTVTIDNGETYFDLLLYNHTPREVSVVFHNAGISEDVSDVLYSIVEQDFDFLIEVLGRIIPTGNEGRISLEGIGIRINKGDDYEY